MTSEAFNLVAGIASIAGFTFGFYFYFQQKKADQVTRGFFQAIKLQNQCIYEELKGASGIANRDAFETLSTQVKAATRSAETLAQTLTEFEDTLWGGKGLRQK